MRNKTMKTNSITIIGNVGTKPETRELRDDKQVTKFTLAYSNERIKNTEWFNVDCWNVLLGERILASVEKGNRIRVTGSLKVNRFEKKDGGGQDFRLVIVLEDFELIPKDDDKHEVPAA
jgi:single stranded DNA-binding protein